MATLREKLGLDFGNVEQVGSGALKDVAAGEDPNITDRQGRDISEYNPLRNWRPLDKDWRLENPDDWWMGPRYHDDKVALTQMGQDIEGLTEEQAATRADVMLDSRRESMIEGARYGAQAGSVAGPAGTALGFVGGAAVGAAVGDFRAEEAYDNYMAEQSAASQLALAEQGQQRALAESIQSQGVGAYAGGGYGPGFGEPDQTLLDGMEQQPGATNHDQWRRSRYGW